MPTLTVTTAKYYFITKHAGTDVNSSVANQNFKIKTNGVFPFTKRAVNTELPSGGADK